VATFTSRAAVRNFDRNLVAGCDCESRDNERRTGTPTPAACWAWRHRTMSARASTSTPTTGDSDELHALSDREGESTDVSKFFLIRSHLPPFSKADL